MTTLDTSTEAGTRRTAWPVSEEPVGRTTGWWGMVLFICTESATFAAFIASYFYLRFSVPGSWPPSGDHPPSLPIPSIGTAVLILSCLPMWLSVRAARADRRASAPLLVVSMLGGIAFVVLQWIDWTDEWPASTMHKDAYGSLMYTITGLHAVHVAIGILMLALVGLGVLVRGAGRAQAGATAVVAMYWYFLSVVAIGVYATVYISPYL